jgi:hypothetical protein
MRYIGLALALAVFAPTAAAPATAPRGCYLPGEIEADQAMNFQTELMVLSDTCGDEFYRDFTVRNRDLIVSYQHLLLDHFHRAGVKSPQASLDIFLTRIANEHALKDGNELRVVLCTQSADLIALGKTIDRDHFHQRAAELAAQHQADYRPCNPVPTLAQKTQR